MKQRIAWSIYALVVVLAVISIWSGEAADNFVEGYTFSGATGLYTGADLDDLVTQSRLASSAFNGDNTNRLFDLDVFTSKVSGTTYLLTLAPDAVTSNNIGDNAISKTNLTGSSVGTYEIIDYSVDSADIATNAILAQHIETNSIDGTKIQNGVINTQHLAEPVKRQVALFQHREAYNVEGGSSTALSWCVRKLNTECYDSGNFASLSSFAITIASSGVYRVTAGSVTYRVNDTFMALWNDSDNILICGDRNRNDADGESAYPQTLQGLLNVDSPPLTVKLMHYTQTAVAGDGLGQCGIVTNMTFTNVYGWIEFDKIR